jgi:hypothetical protein
MHEALRQIPYRVYVLEVRADGDGERNGMADHALVIGEVIHAGLRGEDEPIMCSNLKWHYGG